MKKLRLKKGDIIILAAVICAAVSVLLLINIFSSSGSTAVVEVNGVVAAELSLDEDTVYDVETDGIVTNTVVIKNGCVSVINANCPDKICQNHKPVSKTGESIVCLPNRVIVTVQGGDDEIDGVAQ